MPSATKSAPKTTPLILEKPTQANGAVDNTLFQTIEKKYDTIQVLEPDADKLKALVHDKAKDAKCTNLGASTQSYIYALVNSAFAGQGAGPDGSAVWATENTPQIMKYWGAKFKTYRILLVPSGRAGASKYIATIAELVQIAKLRSAIIAASLNLYGAAKVQSRGTKTVEEEAPKISF